MSRLPPVSVLRELFDDRHPLVDATTVQTYVWAPRRSEERRLPPASAPRPPVSLIATVKNEAWTLGSWLDSILAQTRLPDEIVVVDGGSSDGTWAILQSYANRSPVPFKTLLSVGANIARGRNLAIQTAAGPLIACTDAGCILTSTWLAALTGPFADDRDVEVVAGYYRALTGTDLERAMAAYMVKPLAVLDPRGFLPSGRSVAFTKKAWAQAGGFPEWLTLTAEDTLFAVQLKAVTRRWAFVPEAQVAWRPRPSLQALFRQVLIYARGDGEAGLFPDLYRQRIALWLQLLVMGLLGLAGVGLTCGSRSRGWLLLTLAASAVVARRLGQITVRPTWTAGRLKYWRALAQSAAVVLTITLAMSVGFVDGVRRRALARARVAAGSPNQEAL